MLGRAAGGGGAAVHQQALLARQGRGDLAYQFLTSDEASAIANRFLADGVSVI